MDELKVTSNTTTSSASLNQKIAKSVSNLFHPMTLSCLAFFWLILVGSEPLQQKLLLIALTTLFSSVLPILFIYTQRNWINTDERTERFLPLIVGIVSYFAGFGVLMLLNASILIQALMFCYATNTIIVLLITARWKVSVHTTAATGPLVALTYKFGFVILPLYMIIAFVGISRLILKKHTLAQVIVGMLIGLIGTGAQMYLIFQMPFPL